MLKIRTAATPDIPLVQELTDIIWPATYGSILSPQQIKYMIEMMYGTEPLRIQFEELHHQFLLCYEDAEVVGFASYSGLEKLTYKLHKIYILPNQQGKGIGKFIVDHIIDRIRHHGAVALDLNVNRNNPAKNFYEKLGFTIVREEDIDIGNGYWMNDFVMRKLITPTK